MSALKISEDLRPIMVRHLAITDRRRPLEGGQEYIRAGRAFSREEVAALSRNETWLSLHGQYGRQLKSESASELCHLLLQNAP